MSAVQQIRGGCRGAVVVLILIFLVIFSTLAVALATASGSNVQVASNRHKLNGALHAARSEFECAQYLVRTVMLPQTNLNYVTDAQANQVWSNLCAFVQATALDGKMVPAAPASSRTTEYFPHVAGNYSQPRGSISESFTRHVYENQTYSDALLQVNRHALFRNCAFQNILYIDSSRTSTSRSARNNVRFENCTLTVL